MTIWQPAPGETLLARAPVEFATGAAHAVRGMRWFRDTERNDIQHLLPGWPEGPVYQVRSKAGRGAVGALVGVGRTSFVLMMAVLTGGGGSGPDLASPGRPQDPANEVEDFPVMWAAPGTVARTLPWQLDPGRRGKKRCTHLIVTDRRLVVVGLPKQKAIEDEVLWEVDREEVAQALPLHFSVYDNDLRIEFRDGSWCRLAAYRRDRLYRYLRQPLEVIDHADLSPGQRRRMESFVAEHGATEEIGPPVVTRIDERQYALEVHQLGKVTADDGAWYISTEMGPDGEYPW